MLQVKEVGGMILAVVLFLFFSGGMTAGQMLDPEQVAADEAQAALDPNMVLAAVGDDKLLVWQAEVLMKNGLGGDYSSTANEWLRVTLRALEARQRGMDKTREAQFQQGFRQKYDLGIFVFEQMILDEIPVVTDEEVRVRYEETIDLYVKPLQATIQHIEFPQKAVADKVAAEARKPEVSFDALVEQWARGVNKTTKGYVYGATYDFLSETLGSRVAAEIKAHNDTGIVGPIMGQNGWEVIKVNDFTPGLNRPFEMVKDSLRDSLRSEKYRNTLRATDERLDKEMNVFRSDLVRKIDR